MPTEVYGTSEAKWEAIVSDVVAHHDVGRPVLVGTRSIDKSEIVSRLLAERQIAHTVLNARHVAEEAQIVAQEELLLGLFDCVRRGSRCCRVLFVVFGRQKVLIGQGLRHKTLENGEFLRPAISQPEEPA